MLAMEVDQCFVESALPWVQIHCRAIISVFTKCLAPGIRRLIGESTGKTFCNLKVQRMVRRVSGIAVHSHRHELRIDHDEIFRKQFAVSEKSPALTSNIAGHVQEIR